MAGCGYVCPVCEGRGYTDDGKPCTYCVVPTSGSKKEKEDTDHKISDSEWIDKVHNNSCCSDIGKVDENSNEEESL